MSLFNDVSQFLENRIDEFLKNNPHLELQALEEKLREQERETAKLLTDLQARQDQVEREIMTTAQEVKRWDDRIQKAKAANRQDLLEPAMAHMAGLIRQGNQLWGHMEVLKDRYQQTQTLLQKIKQQRQEAQVRVTQAKADRAAAQAAQYNAAVQSQWGSTWATGSSAAQKPMDPLEKEFAKWEADEELNQMKREMGR
jgi:uncharacterized protein (TIGR04376 family)